MGGKNLLKTFNAPPAFRDKNARTGYVRVQEYGIDTHSYHAQQERKKERKKEERKYPSSLWLACWFDV
jgi:hypothetical protein